MDVGEIVASCLAVAALALAGFNTYCQFFRKQDYMRASLLQLQMLSEEPSVDVVFSNTGNRAATVYFVALMFPIEGSGGGHVFPWSKLNGECNPQSIVVNPGESIHRKIHFCFTQARLKDVTLGRSLNEADFQIAAQLQFTAIDSSGRRKTKTLPGIEISAQNGTIVEWQYEDGVVRLLP